MAEHTPGPYRHHNETVYCGTVPDLHQVARADSPETARLIAAAPDLLEALDAACSLIEDAEKDTNWCSGDSYGDNATVRFRQIIAKATGKDA